MKLFVYAIGPLVILLLLLLAIDSFLHRFINEKPIKLANNRKNKSKFSKKANKVQQDLLRVYLKNSNS